MAREVFFFKNHAETNLGWLVPDFLLFIEKTSNKQNVKVSGQHLSFDIFW